MTKKSQSKLSEKTLTEYKLLLGPAPVLSSEDLKAYDDMMTCIIEEVGPRNLIELLYINEFVVASWEILRLSLHKTLLIEREHCRHQEMEKKRRQKEQKRKQATAERLADMKRKEEAQRAEQTEQPEQAGEAPEQADQINPVPAPTTLSERMFDLEEVVDSIVQDVDEIVEAPADEIDHAKALQTGIDYFEQLEQLVSGATRRRNDALRQLEFCRQGLSQLLRSVSDDIIDAEFNEHAAPSLAGPDGDGQ